MVRTSLSVRLGAIVGTACLAVAPLVGAVAPAAAASPTPPPTPAPSEPPPTPKAPASAPVVARTGPISWSRCGGMQCGELPVPLDYRDASKGTTTLAIARRPADRPSRKLGVIFVNPGGPGGSAAASVPLFAQILGRDVRARFDIVGVEPRGVGGSDLALCEGTKGQKQPVPEQVFPWKRSQAAAFLEADEFNRRLCRATKPKILPYMTTADVARDMDRVRAALGQKQLNYYGVSYGSYLGATYANLFPQRVRTMVVDGVLDPVAWATGRGGEAATTPTTSRLRSGIGGHEALMAAIAECENVGPSRCPEHATIRDDWAALSGRLREATIRLGGPGAEGFDLTYDMLVALTNGSLYDGEGIPDLFALIHAVRVEADQASGRRVTVPSAALTRAYTKVVDRDEANRRGRIGYDPPAPGPAEDPTPRYAPLFEGVVCSETRNPRDATAWIAAGERTDRSAPGFGPLWTWTSSVCAGWPAPGKNAYHGPFTKKPAGGMMVMSTTHDPATPYSGARVMRSLSPGSRLVTVDGWGHGTVDTSGCATTARTSYLLRGRLPSKDLTCRADHALFTSLD